ncbi:MAG TPA: ADOP family duplicated permease [Gemmatimonadaceae bacterium]|nr:ADOP family duplicated permease [Gemmatimonadaceae bacterium]
MRVDMTLLTRSLRHAARSLRRAPAFSLAVVASLGISIAAITTVFSIADAVLFRPLPYESADRLVWISSVRTQRSDAPFTVAEYADYRERARTIDIAAYTAWNAGMATPTGARRLQGMRISANAFDVLGVSPSAGRLLRDADDQPGAPRAVVLSHGFWMDQFAGDRRIIGDLLRLNDEPHEIVGVLPRHFPMPLRDVDVLVPLSPELDPNRHVRTSTSFLLLFGRARGDASLAVAGQELSRIAHELRSRFPTEYASRLGVSVTPMREYLVGDTRQTFVVMLGAATLLLLIALANVLNLVLIRGIARKGELALRRALGGSGRQLAYGVASEAVLLAAAGATAGILLTNWAVSLVRSSSIGVLRLDESQVDERTLVFVVAIAILASLLSSAFQFASVARAAPRQALSAIGRGQHGSRGEARARGALLLAQVGFAVLLTIVTATMALSLARLQAVQLGYRPDSVFVARMAMPPHRYQTVGDLSRFAGELEASLRSVPGVVAAGAISIAPLSGGLAVIPFRVGGRRPAHERERLEAHLRAITPGYLTAVGATLRAGRDFSDADNEVVAPVAIISRALAERYLAGIDPLGQEILVDDNNVGPRPIMVVGVVDDMRHVTIEGPAPVDIYIPMAQLHPDNLRLVTNRHFWTVRVESGASDYPRAFARTLAAIDRDVALSRVEPMRTYVDRSLAARKFSVVALLGFAVIALVLATIGVYGVVSYSVAQRRREIGVRLALGATSAGVMRFFVAPAVRLALLGAAIGVAGALSTRRVIAGLLFGVTPAEPVTMGIVATMLLLTCAIAAAIPARRAAGTDPAVALRDS